MLLTVKEQLNKPSFRSDLKVNMYVILRML